MKSHPHVSQIQSQQTTSQSKTDTHSDKSSQTTHTQYHTLTHTHTHGSTDAYISSGVHRCPRGPQRVPQGGPHTERVLLPTRGFQAIRGTIPVFFASFSFNFESSGALHSSLSLSLRVLFFSISICSCVNIVVVQSYKKVLQRNILTAIDESITPFPLFTVQIERRNIMKNRFCCCLTLQTHSVVRFTESCMTTHSPHISCDQCHIHAVCFCAAIAVSDYHSPTVSVNVIMCSAPGRLKSNCA